MKKQGIALQNYAETVRYPVIFYFFAFSVEKNISLC